MHLSLSPDQTALRDAVARLYTKEAHPERVREAESAADGIDRNLWQAIVQMGLPTMGVAEALGGGGASLVDLAVVAEQHGAHLAPAPLLDTMVAARALAGTEAGAPLVARLADGEIGALALRPARDHVATLVPAGAAANVVVALDGDRLVTATPDEPPPRRRTMHKGPVADVDLTGATVLAEGDEARRLFDRAVDEWRTLVAAAQAGLARAALDIGVAYVKDRHQFGVPIGSFQSVQHRLADLHTAVDGARLLAYEAAWAADRGEPGASALAAQASWFCGQTADDATEASLHYHGGYGFMEEYDIQLYVRRAKAWRLLLGDPRRELQTIAERRWVSPPPAPPRPAEAQGTEGGTPEGRPADDEPAGMDFSFDAETLALQQEMRQFLAENLTPDIIERALSTGTMHDWGLHKKLAERGYLSAGWPKEVGGRGLSAVTTTALIQELFRAGAPVDGLAIVAMVGATLLLRGNEQQRTEILPRILSGEVMCCLGYTEPDSGSDVAAAQTRAERIGEGPDAEWVINGQKMFTTLAHEASYVFLLTRTDPTAPKHRGLTMFLVPMDTPGIEITPVHTLGGERTNITFYNDVRVPDSCRVGEVNDGWSVMHAALVYERNSSNWGEPAHLVESAVRWAATTQSDGTRPLDDPITRERLARWDTLVEVGRLLLYRSAWMAASGALPQVEGSMAKLFLTETFVRAANDLVDLAGTEGLLPRHEEGAVLNGLLEHGVRHAVVTTIYGGSSEIQREIVAQRGLGLPRGR
ncbi:MAG TPA: acyl-CoA dehydrogenase [Acidimicrobiales bacterium]